MDKLELPIIGWIDKSSASEVPEGTPGAIPLVGIPFMSDKKWLEKLIESRQEHPEMYQKAGENVEQTIEEIKKSLQELKEQKTLKALFYALSRVIERGLSHACAYVRLVVRKNYRLACVPSPTIQHSNSRTFANFTLLLKSIFSIKVT